MVSRQLIEDRKEAGVAAIAYWQRAIVQDERRLAYSKAKLQEAIERVREATQRGWLADGEELDEPSRR